MTDSLDKLLLQTKRINALEPPTERNSNSLYNLISNTGSQTLNEATWIRHLDDLVALVPDQERGFVEASIEETFKLISRRLTSFLFRTKSQRRRSGKEHINLYSHQRFETVASVLVTVMASVLLLAPIAILYTMPRKGLPQIGVIFFFIQVFAVCCALLTTAKKHEVYMTTAAYAAVLVVFLGNNYSPS